MAWTLPRYSRGQVDKAGKSLVKNSAKKLFYASVPPSDLEIVNNWRSSHILPLFVIRRTLENRAKALSQEALVADRIKRLPSIEQKLVDNEYRNLRLTQIEDIGGCRAILPTIGQTVALDGRYSQRGIGSEFSRRRDYITQPKPDGYRSIHLVYKYRSARKHYEAYNGHRIEIQIRSRLQHTWATAVEMLQTFADIRVKLGPVETNPERIPGTLREESHIATWRRFFVLMASAMALRENQPVVEGTSSSQDTLKAEIRDLARELHVVDLFASWSFVSKDVPHFTGRPDTSQFLVQLNPQTKQIFVKGYRAEESSTAFLEYLDAEKGKGSFPSANVVLVSVNSLQALQSAYPNYFADTANFVGFLGHHILEFGKPGVSLD